ncbi:protoheme IX farnesyltransferase [Auriscalpium vulgare]|uniref:Protoheme IX farnesyltransferase n=1 Tax=Auriscalpium vulgare TaxID=40419 RepID=A0ACB8RZI6_9AGAM|nr:protoheme IX farnesyltransferase [Auriscalpium vulgare]
MPSGASAAPLWRRLVVALSLSAVRSGPTPDTSFLNTRSMSRSTGRMYGMGGRGAKSLSRFGGSNIDFSSFFRPNPPLAAAPPPPPPAAAPPALPASAYRALPALTLGRRLALYGTLSKTQLSALVALTAMSGVALSPYPASVPALLATALGTALCAASANALNQLQEAPFDAQMARTRGRPLVRRALSPAHAAAFAGATGVAGPALLAAAVNPATALLGAANIALYAGAYTWAKRRTVWNTWLGGVVGGIPPLMGWAAGGGHLLAPPVLFLPPFLSAGAGTPGLALVDNALAPAALFLLLFSWQFPHFNALSHFVRDAYARGGYRMLCVLDPARNTRVALRHAVLLAGITAVLVPLSGLTTWAFALTSLAPNAVFVAAAWRWHRFGGDKNARALFHHSLWYLPVILGLMMVHKQGLEWRKWVGFGTVEDEEEDSAINESS